MTWSDRMGPVHTAYFGVISAATGEFGTAGWSLNIVGNVNTGPTAVGRVYHYDLTRWDRRKYTMIYVYWSRYEEINDRCIKRYTCMTYNIICKTREFLMIRTATRTTFLKRWKHKTHMYAVLIELRIDTTVIQIPKPKQIIGRKFYLYI